MEKIKGVLCLIAICIICNNAQAASVLLFNGTGTTSGDVSAVEAQLNNLGYSYATANSSQLNGMSRTQLDGYKLFINPGGNSITMGQNLTSTATSNVHDAVVLDGISYLGICAGGFMGETSSLYNTFKFAASYFGFYDEGATENVSLSLPNNSKLDVVYWNGPVISNFGYAVAKYSNGAVAIAEDFVGAKNGFVILSGVHPEAPFDWDVSGYTSADATAANAYSRTLIKAAYNKTLLQHY